jgi:hypothetical protein
LTSVLSAAGPGKKRPSYAAHLKKVVVEEGYSSATLVVVLQMVVRNREEFYHSRSTFIPIIINSLNRLGLSSQASLENRVLAVDMASTLYWWDRQAAKQQSASQAEQGPQPMDVDGAADAGAAAAPAGDADKVAVADGARLAPAMEDNVMNFLLRMAFVSCEVRDRDESGWRKLHSHCLDVLKDAARFRPPTALKLSFFDRLLQTSIQNQQQAQQGHPPVPEASPALLTGIRVVNIFMASYYRTWPWFAAARRARAHTAHPFCALQEFQPDNMVVCCPNQIAQMIEPALYSKHRSPVELLSTTVRLLFSMFPVGPHGRGTDASTTASKIQARVCELLTK